MLHFSNFSFNRDAVVTAYSASSVIAPSPNTPLTFTTVNPRGTINYVVVSTDNSASVPSGFRLFLFSETFTPPADYAPSGLTLAQTLSFVAAIDVGGAVSAGGSAVVHTALTTRPIPFFTPTLTLFGFLRTAAAFTPTANQQYNIELAIDTNGNYFNI